MTVLSPLFEVLDLTDNLTSCFFGLSLTIPQSYSYIIVLDPTL